jgi:hypothetical protein
MPSIEDQLAERVAERDTDTAESVMDQPLDEGASPHPARWRGAASRPRIQDGERLARRANAIATCISLGHYDVIRIQADAMAQDLREIHDTLMEFSA